MKLLLLSTITIFAFALIFSVAYAERIPVDVPFDLQQPEDQSGLRIDQCTFVWLTIPNSTAIGQPHFECDWFGDLIYAPAELEKEYPEIYEIIYPEGHEVPDTEPDDVTEEDEIILPRNVQERLEKIEKLDIKCARGDCVAHEEALLTLLKGEWNRCVLGVFEGEHIQQYKEVYYPVSFVDVNLDTKTARELGILLANREECKWEQYREIWLGAQYLGFLRGPTGQFQTEAFDLEDPNNEGNIGFLSGVPKDQKSAATAFARQLIVADKNSNEIICNSTFYSQALRDDYGCPVTHQAVLNYTSGLDPLLCQTQGQPTLPGEHPREVCPIRDYNYVKSQTSNLDVEAHDAWLTLCESTFKIYGSSATYHPEILDLEECQRHINKLFESGELMRGSPYVITVSEVTVE